MDLKTELTRRLEGALEAFFAAEGIARPEGIEIATEVPRNRDHGDLATNLAMQTARALKRNPRQVAEQLIAHIDRTGLVEEVSIAGPGFLNFRLSTGATGEILRRIAEQGDRFGCTQSGRGRKVLIEFVSANPTGPLHIGHARNAVVGDVLGRALDAAGYQVSREYYFNDAGVQMDMLGETLRLRVHEQLGRTVRFPEPKTDPETGEEHAQYYKGAYMIDIARRMVGELGAEQAGGEHPTRFYTDFAVREILKTIDADLKTLGIAFDNWFSETTLHNNGAVAETLEELRRLGQVYDKDGAQWLRTTAHGDEKDRVVVKSDGHYTYVTPDIAYHRYKFDRGYEWLINVLGGDHHGYVPRLQAAVAALGHSKDALQCVIIQMVSLLKDGETLKLSTRGGKFLTIKDAIDELGRDVVRFFFAMRSPDAQMTFDWALAKDTSMDNPVYYVQYAHARCCSLLRKAEESGAAYGGISGADPALLADPGEQALIQALGRLPEAIEACVAELTPHHLANYLHDTAALFHNYFTQGNTDASLRIIREDSPALTQARLALIDGLRTVLANALRILGVEPMARM